MVTRPCGYCGNELTARWPSKLKKYCNVTCSGRANRGKKAIQHGYSRAGQRTREWTTWAHMCRRVRELPRYQVLGMEPRWTDPVIFIEYVLRTIGPHPGVGWSIDRINNDRGYFPGNIRWATREQQAQNHLQRNQHTR